LNITLSSVFRNLFLSATFASRLIKRGNETIGSLDESHKEVERAFTILSREIKVDKYVIKKTKKN